MVGNHFVFPYCLYQKLIHLQTFYHGQSLRINHTTFKKIYRKAKNVFVSTAPLSQDGSVNVSPKGLDSLRILDETTVAYLLICLKALQKEKKWMEHLDFSNAHKTPNMMDRLMRAMNRYAFNSQMFHLSTSNISKNFRAFALLYNFAPSCLDVWDESKKLTSPAVRLNGFTYHEDWLQNLLISASMGGFRNHRNPL